MNRDMLIDAVAARVGVPRHSAQVFLHACFDVVKSMLRSGDDVVLPDLGHWSPRLADDGSLIDVRYSAFVPADHVPEMAEALSGAIDARHFIPAVALRPRFAPEMPPVDVAAIVAEVRRTYGLMDEPEIETLEQEVDALSADEGTIDASITAVVVGADVPSTTAMNEEDTLLEIEMEAEGYPIDIVHEESLETEETFVPEESVELEPTVVTDTGDSDPISDEAVFHRNRDQLYHPPDEPGRRPLLLTAAVLTLLVIVIIIYMLLDKNEPRELPGSDPVGQTLLLRDRN